MALRIEDGKGSGAVAGVSPDNRLLAITHSLRLTEFAGITGASYEISTGVITLTSAAESAVLYIKNTDPTNIMVITSVEYFFGKATVSGDIVQRKYGGVTTGTIVSAGTAYVPFNRNLGNTVPPVATFLIGAEGKTVTNGTKIVERVFQDATHQEVESNLVLPNGTSFVITVQPPTGSTSMKVSASIGIVFINPANF